MVRHSARHMPPAHTLSLCAGPRSAHLRSSEPTSDDTGFRAGGGSISRQASSKGSIRPSPQQGRQHGSYMSAAGRLCRGGACYALHTRYVYHAYVEGTGEHSGGEHAIRRTPSHLRIRPSVRDSCLIRTLYWTAARPSWAAEGYIEAEERILPRGVCCSGVPAFSSSFSFPSLPPSRLLLCFLTIQCACTLVALPTPARSEPVTRCKGTAQVSAQLYLTAVRT